MTNNKKEAIFINTASIKTEESLTDFLAQIGFKSRPIPYKDNIRIMRQGKDESEIQRYLFWQDNKGFQSQAVISIENDKFCVYYYEIENDLYRVWETFIGDVEIQKIKDTIRSATTDKEISLRFYSFYCDRAQTDLNLALVLSAIGFKSQKRPDLAKSIKDAAVTSGHYRLLYAKENNLDADVLISARDEKLFVYHYDVVGSFQQVAELTGYVAYSALHDAVRQSKITDVSEEQ